MKKNKAGEKGVERDYSKSQSARLLLRLLSPYKGMCVVTLLMLLCDIVGTLYVPTELSALINAAISTKGSPEILSHGLRMLAASVIGSGGCIISFYLASRLAANIGRDMRVAVYRKSLELSGFDFGQFGTGSMITRTLSDANVVQQTFLMTFIMLAPVPIICVVSVVLAFGVDYQMGWLLLSISVVMSLIMVAAVRKSAPIFLIMQGFVDRMNTRLREHITGVRVIRAFGKEEDARRGLDQTFEDYARNAIRVNMVFATADCATFFLMNLVEVLVIWLGADRVGAHAMQIGSISALVEYAMIIMFFMMMGQFAILQLPRAMACLTRATEVLEAVPSVADPEEPKAIGTGAATRGDVVASFDHVGFRYADADEETLHDVDFRVRRGEVTAVIGNTGSGKSTIAKLLLRFHDVTSGSLSFMGTDVRGVRRADLRARIGYVPQKAWLFSGTVASNLRDGDDSADEERLWHALDVAQGGFVRDLPEGLAAPVAQGGSNFSGGQRQRLAIARALVRKADLYVFDDSFSALDFKTDALLRHALKDELADAAVVIIAQRVSTIRDAAQIVVLDEGRVVGLGTHDELMRICPTYQAIARSQERGGVEDGR
ncbi:MAG: ABC transporter ATP-binding protein/permease [Olsenella sp.]|jgi:ATP-binding cassette subfamily B protein|nr:ABC transporter ATP-binding protein/permease [Olsenella sp.]MCI1288852.1 ABC transporter ATP-binding protein/permease [Olsenella sp.]